MSFLVVSSSCHSYVRDLTRRLPDHPRGWFWQWRLSIDTWWTQVQWFDDNGAEWDDGGECIYHTCGRCETTETTQPEQPSAPLQTTQEKVKTSKNKDQTGCVIIGWRWVVWVVWAADISVVFVLLSVTAIVHTKIHYRLLSVKHIL